MALRVFQSARAALESTRGTNLTPTRLIYFEGGSHDQQIGTIRPAELRNSYFGFHQAAAGPERNTLNFNGRVSYDDIIWWGNLFFKGVASGTGAGADKTWAFLPSATTDDVKTATIQLAYADTIGTAPGIELGFCFGSTLNLHFEKNDDGAATFAAQLMSPEAASQIIAFTGSLTDRTTTPASANNTQLFSDPGGTIGTTADPTFVSLDFNLALGPVPLYTLNNSTAATNAYRPAHRTWTATLVRQFTSDTYWDDYVDKTVQKIRCRTLGPTLGASNYKIDLDLYGVFTARAWSDVDGIITETLTLEPIYDTTATTDHRMDVVNATASIT